MDVRLLVSHERYFNECLCENQNFLNFQIQREQHFNWSNFFLFFFFSTKMQLMLSGKQTGKWALKVCMSKHSWSLLTGASFCQILKIVCQSEIADSNLRKNINLQTTTFENRLHEKHASKCYKSGPIIIDSVLDKAMQWLFRKSSFFFFFATFSLTRQFLFCY